MKTSPRVSFGLYALDIKQDSTPNASGQQDFSNVADLRNDNATKLPYITYEPDYWLLDGKYKILPTNYAAVHVGLVSSEMSDQNGVFETAPFLIVYFSQEHSSDGLTLRFQQESDDYASLIRVIYFDASDSVIMDTFYEIESWEFSAIFSVENFKKISITFLKTSKPYRYLRLTGIDYGQLLYFDAEDIKEASIIEELDFLSAEVRYNTFNLKLYSKDEEFNILNPTGLYASLQQRQPLAVHEIVDNTTVFLGQFYLSEWENLTDTETQFTCLDLVGVLDTLAPYKGGIWLSGINLEDLVQAIMEEIQVPYDLDVNLYGTVIKGWLPICTYREALQQIAFAAGAYVTCSRSSTINIHKTKIAFAETAAQHIGNDSKGIDSPIKLKSQVTGVEVTAHNYVVISEVKELYNGSLGAGLHEIQFSEPVHDLSVTGATISASGTNYAILNVASAGTVVLTGQAYADTTKVFSHYMGWLSSTVKPNILRVKDATLVNTSNGQAVTDRIYDYHTQRYIQKTKLFSPSAAVGDIISTATKQADTQLICGVEKMDINLLGFVVDTEMTGVTNAVD